MSPPDEILIEGLQFLGHHGVYARERREGCRFELDVVLQASTRQAAETDRLRDTVDYGAVASTLLALGRGESCFLLERLAERMCAAVLADYPTVGCVALTLRKLGAAVDGQPRAVGVRVLRARAM